MKKLLGVLLAMTLSWPVSAAILHNVEVVGEIQTIASDVRHDTEYGFYNRGAWTRAMAGLSTELVEDVTANILFQYAYQWGENNEDNFGFSNGDGIKLVNANVALHNLLCAFDLTVGRQFYGEDGSAVIYFGPNHYNAEAGQYARALDAAKLTYNDDVKSVTLLAGRVADVMDGLLPDPYALRSNIFGGDVKLNVTDNFTVQGYLYDFTDGTETDGEGYYHLPAYFEWDHSGVWGAKLGLNTEAFRASAEYARNFAGHRFIKEHGAGHAGLENFDELGTGYMVKADLAADIKAVTARGSFVYAKEGFLSQGNYAPGLLMGHVYSANMFYNIFNYSGLGLRMFNLGFDYKPAEKWTVSLDGYAFQGRNGHHAATLEADLTAKYQHNEYVELFAGVGYAKYGNDKMFNVVSGYGDTYKEAIGSDNVKGQLGMLIKF